MANAKLPPFVRWRNGRPRIVHGPRERELGLVDRDLRHEGGPWFTFEEAAAAGAENYASVLALRGGPRPKKARAALTDRKLETLLEDWFNSTEVQDKLSVAGIKSYRKSKDAVIFKPETRGDAASRREKERAAGVLRAATPERAREKFAAASVDAIGAPELRAFYNYAKVARGHHMALSMIATISAAWTWGRESMRWRLGANPRHAMEFDRPAGRVVLIALEEFRALVTAADAIGRHSIGDSFYLGLWTGQRQTDRLALKDAGLLDGRRRFLQSKTGAVVSIKEAPALAARLDQARARVAAIKLRLSTRPETIVVDETTGLPYNDTTYRHWVAEVRELAIAGDAELGLAPCPSLAFTNPKGEPDMKQDRDLRDTCVILMFRAGVDALGICNVTGHSYQSVQTIIKHYLGRDLMRADAAIDRLVDFVLKEGATR